MCVSSCSFLVSLSERKKERNIMGAKKEKRSEDRRPIVEVSEID